LLTPDFLQIINTFIIQPLEILFEDQHLVAINKPHNLLVHRSRIAADETVFALDMLREQLGLRLNPCHRIDRKTGGVLLFSKTKDADRGMQGLFEARQTQKKYLTLVRGWPPETGSFDRDLENENGVLKSAETHFKSIAHYEVPLSAGKYPHSRYSLVEVVPITGRMHQIRRHFAQARHYIIGDKTHGDCKHNKLFETHFGLFTMMLHAAELGFVHPLTAENILIRAPYQDEFSTTLALLATHKVP
jgi:tRNA pseudouridine65 synthase